MTRLFLVACALLVGMARISGQTATFQREIEGVNGLFCAEQSVDGHFWLGTFLGKIIRLDAAGQWLGGYDLKRDDTASARFVYDLERTSDGGVWALYDRTNVNTALDDYLILARLNADGLPQWQTAVHYGEVLHWAHNRLASDPAGNAYVLSVRFRQDNSSEPSRIIFVKVAPDGHIVWTKSYFNNARHYPRALQRLSDGSFLICGNGQLGQSFGFLLRLDAEGQLLWSRRYPQLLFKDFVQLPDGGWVFCATQAGTLPQAASVVRTDDQGNIVWAKRLEMDYALNWIPDLAVQASGDLLVFNHETPKEQPVPDMICLSPDGDLRWAKRYDLCHNYGISAGLPTLDGGIAGVRFRAGGHLFLKTDSQGNCSACPATTVPLPLTAISDAPLPYDWQVEDRLPPTAATVDFTPLNLTLQDYCGNEVPVNGIVLSDDTLCAFQPLTAAATGLGPSDDYQWFFPGGLPTKATGKSTVNGIHYDLPGTDTVRLVVTTGFCRDTFSAGLTVVSAPMPFYLGADSTVCGANKLHLNATTPGATDYRWQDGVKDAMREAGQSGQYIATATNGACFFSDTIGIQVLEGLSVVLPGDTTICGADTIWLDASTAGADRYTWNDGFVTARRPVTKQGYYAVTAFRGACSAAAFVAINPFPRPPALPADTLVCENAELVFNAGESVAGQIFWNDKQGFAEFRFEGTGWLRRVVAYRHCRFADSVFVRRTVCRDGFAIYVPNAFSPNGDGQNDLFEIFGDGLEVQSFQLYDRWGNLLYESKNENPAQWDGGCKGRAMAPGVYLWLARLRQRGREGWLSGEVSLLR